jgi:hypothetical protein
VLRASRGIVKLRRGGRDPSFCQIGGIHAIAQHHTKGAEHRGHRPHLFAGYSIVINAVIFAVVGIFAAEGRTYVDGDFVAFSACSVFFTGWSR